MATVFERWAQTAGELKAAKATPEQAEAAREELRKRFVEKMKEAKLDSAARAAALSRFEYGTNALSIKHGLKKEADPLTEEERYALEHPVLGGITQAGKELVAPLAQGVQRIAGGAARLLNDIGDNEKGTALDRFANSMDDAQASVDDWAGRGYAEADGVRGFAKSALQNAPQIALSFLPGAALGKAASLAKAAKGAQAGAKVLKYGMPVAAGLSFGQNFAGEYGDARKQTEDKLAKASPDDLRASKAYGSDFESLERKFFEEGMSADDAAVAARDALVDSISENRADSAATINTALEFVAPGAMAVMPGFAKTGSRLASDLALAGKMASGGRFGSKAANLSDLKDVGLQFLQEGAQGGVTERVAEGARANAFNDEVNYGSVLKSAALEGLAGGIIGGGAQMASGGTSRRRAQDAVDEAQARREQYSAALNNAKAERQRLSEIRNQRPLTEDENIELSAATMEEQQASAAVSEIDSMMADAGLQNPGQPPAPQSTQEEDRSAPDPAAGQPDIAQNPPPEPASGLSGVVQRAQTSTAPDLTAVVSEAIASGQTPDFTALAQASNRDRSEVVDLFNRHRTLVELADSGDLNGMRDMAARMTADPQEQQLLIERAVAVRDQRRAMASQPQPTQQEQPQQPATPIKTPRDTAYEKMLADTEASLASGASDVDTFLAVRKKYGNNKDLGDTDINGVIDDAKASLSGKREAAAKREAAIESAIPHLKAGDEVSAVTALANAGITDDADIQAVFKEANSRLKAKPAAAQAKPQQSAQPTVIKSPMEQAVEAVSKAQEGGKGVKLATIAKKYGVGLVDLARQVAAAKTAPINTKQPEERKASPVLALPAPKDAPVPADQPLVSRHGKLMPKAQADAMAEQSAAEKRDMRRAMSEEAGNPTGVPSGLRPRVDSPARAAQKAVLPDVILRNDGEPFPSETEATRAMNRKGAQETHEVAPAPKGGGVVIKRKQANTIDIEKDDILAAIAKAGGVNWEQARKQGGFDPAESGRRGSGILRVFKKNGGMTLDGMAEHLSQFGYPVTDENGDYTVNSLLDAMDTALRGGQVGTPQFNERIARQMYEQEAELRAIDDAFDGRASGDTPSWLDDGADALAESVIDGDTQPSAVLADALSEVENERTIASPTAGAGQEAESGAEAGAGQGGNAPTAGARKGGQQEGKGSTGQDSGDQAGFQLTAQTEAERLAEEQRQAADLEAKRKEEEKARLKAQADRELSSFTLTGSDRPADVAMAAGQNDLFAPNTRGQKEAEKAVASPKTSTTISDADYAQVVDAAKYLKDIVYSMDNLVGSDFDLLAALSSDLGKSGRDTILMDAFNVTRDVAHNINNQLDDRKPNKLRAVDMQDALDVFPMLKKVIDDAKEIVRKRDERRAQRNAAAHDAPVIESKPEPVKWFGSRDKAEAWIAKTSRVNGGAYHVVQAGPSRFEVFAGKKAAAPAAPVEPNAFPIGKDGMPLRKAIDPLSQADALIALMDGNKIVFNRDTEYQEEIWLEENTARNTWVVKTRSGGAVVTEGPAGPNKAWSKMDAAAKAVEGKVYKANLRGRAIGDVLTDAEGTMYRIDSLGDDGTIRLIKNPDMLSERPTRIQQDQYDRILKESVGVTPAPIGSQPYTEIPTEEAIRIATDAGRKRASEIYGWREKQSGRASVREAIMMALWEAAPSQKATDASDDVDRIYKTLFDEKEAPANPIPGGPGYTSEMADKDLDAMLEQQYRNGIVADDRLAERIRRQEKLIETLRAEERAKQSPAEDLDSMFDDVLAEVTGRSDGRKTKQPISAGPKWVSSTKEERKEILRAAGYTDVDQVRFLASTTWASLTDPVRRAVDGVVRSRDDAKQERTAGQAAASAAKNTGMALGDAIDGLGKLFGGKGTLGSGPVFDEETYAKAKPYFIAAISHLKAAGSDLREAMRAVVKMVVDKFGVDAAENMKPYVVQFIADVRDGKIDDPAATLNGSNTNEDAGNDVRKLDTASQGALEGVSPGQVQGAATGRGTGAGTDEGGRGNGSADGSVAGAGGDRNGGVGDRAGRVSVSGAGAGGVGRGRSRTASGKGRAVSGGPAAGNESVTSAGVATDASQPSMALEPGRIYPPQLTEDFIIEDDLGLGEGGQRTKYKNNAEAIRLIRDLEATGRTATTDEQKVLAKYVGWGGIPQAFDPDNKDWSAQYAELKGLLSDDEWESAKESTQYAHYTSREIINGMYAAVRRLGFTGGNVLEAGGGVGNFIGLMPVDLRTNGKVTLVEREAIAAAIAKHLYPRQNVRAEDFTGFGKGQDGQYDMQIGNPPFSSNPLTDKSGRKHLTGLSVHNYFIAKGVDMLRDGGIMAVVVSNSFMDAGNVRAREYIAKRAKLLGAIRLPNNAFSKNANTQVTTDIIFLQKLPESGWGSKAAIADGKRWVGVTTVSDPMGKGEVALNQYFADNRGMMLGAWGKFGTMYGPDQPALVARPGQDTGAMLMRAIAALPEVVYTPASVSRTKAMEGALLEKLHDNTVDEGGFYVSGGKLWRRVADSAGEEFASEITPDTVISGSRPIGQHGVERLSKLAGIRRTMRDLLAAEAEDRKSDMDRLRKDLNARYDAYVADNGRINDPTTKRLMRDDPDYPLIAALEMDYEPGIGPAAAKAAGIKPQKSKAKKADIFDKRVIEARKPVTKADSPQDAINISMAERGRLDAEYIGRLLDVPASDVLGQLASGSDPLLFRDPATDEYVLRDAYLSGNVREKLKQAKAAGLMSNARALEAVQPEDIPASKISVRIGSPWVPVGVYADFAANLFGDGTKTYLRYVKSNGSFTGAIIPGSEVMSSTKFGTKDYNGDALLLALMNNRQIKVMTKDADGKAVVNAKATEDANSKADDIKQAFQDWIFKDADRAEVLVRAYNDANNNYVVRKYDGSWLKFPGKTPAINFRRHQRNAIARTIQDRTTLYDHVVGAGKTFTAIASAMEMRRMGLIKKPLMVVPNHLVGQWASDFYRLYPGAKVLAATKKDFERENRRRFLAKIASGDWDAVIIAHSSFERIRPSSEFEQRFIQAEIDRIMREAKEVEKSDGDEQEKKRTVKQLAAMQERLENRIAKLREKPMDDLLDFQQLGVDQLFVDEAHLFKNLMFTTKMQNVRGLGDPTGSQRAYDMYIKTNQIMEQNGRGQGVTFMTGTPVSNSLAEMYHMMRYLMPRQMQQLGFESFDAWANTYASVNQVWMQTAGGDGFKAQNRMSNFDNVPELLRLFDQVADTVTMDDIKAAYKEETGKDFPLPKLLTGRRQPVSLDKTPAQEAYMKEIVERLKKIEGRKGPPKKGEDNHLTVMSDARKAAMDIRLVDSAVIDREKGARVDRASEEIFARWKKHGADLGTQLVFADLGTPVSTVKSEVKEYEAIMARISAGEDPDTIAMAQLGDDSAAAKVSDAEDARSELDAKGQDWLTAIEGAKRGFSVYDDLKKALMEKGIPENQIAFIHSYNTDDQKAALFRKVNKGEIRILMGSTAKMGAGTNVQKRLVALHHLDVPWKPSDLEQREGRIIRQGNELADKNPNFEVEILAYVTKDTLDMRMWQIQEVKLKMINQLRTRSVDRELENAFEDMEMSAGEMQAAATGNMDMLREIQLRTEVQKLEKKQRAFDAGKADAIAGIRRATREIERLPAQIAAYERLNKASEDVQLDVFTARNKFKATINGKEYSNHTEAAKVLRNLVDAVEVGEDGKERKAKLDVSLNGEQFTNRQKLAEAFARLSGDNEPFVFDAGDGKVYRVDDAAEAVMDTVASARDADGEKLLGNMGDYRVSIEYGGEKLNQDEVFEVHASIGDDDLPSAVVRAKPGDDRHAAKEILKAVRNMVRDAGSSLSSLKASLEKAKKNLADLSKIDTASEWPDSDKLARMREEHKALRDKMNKEAEANKEQGKEQGGELRMSVQSDTSGPGLTTSRAREILSADPVLSKALPFIDIRNSREGVPDGAEPMYLPAWHGSPHKFDKFSTENIGTGEGAQAYGWGMYFAGSRDVAEWYRENLSVRVQDAKAIASEFAGLSDADAVVAIRKAADDHYMSGWYAGEKLYLDTAKWIEDGRPEGKQGTTYKVEIPEDDTFLLWDKPFSEQPDAVKKALESVRDELTKADVLEDYLYQKNAEWDELTGKDIYEILKRASMDDALTVNGPGIESAQKDGMDDKAASMYLFNDGISGIKYLDGTSRSKGEGNYNYVVFNDDDVEITGRYSTQEGGPEGYYANGRITLFADNIRATGSMSADDRLKWVAFHEITHRGVANLAESQAYLSELERAGKNPYVKNLAKKIYEARQSLDAKYHVSMEVAAEEALAEINAALRTGNVKQIKDQYGLHFPLSIRPRAKSAVARFFEAVKRIINRMFGRGLTDAQVEDLLRRTNAAGMTPDGGPGRGSDAGARYSPSPKDWITEQGRIAKRVFSKETAQRDLSLWQKTLGTQLGTALKNPAFKKVYDLTQRLIQHVNNDAYDSLNAAPDVLSRLEDWSDYKRDLGNTAKEAGAALMLRQSKRRKDMTAAAEVLFEGTRFDKKVYSDKELDAFKLTADQKEIYRQARAAIDKSVGNAGKSQALNVAMNAEAINWATIERLVNLDLEPEVLFSEVSDLIDARIAATKMEAENSTNEAEIKKLDKQAEKLAAALASIGEIQAIVEKSAAEGYAPLMRWGKYTVSVIDPADGKTLRFHMQESKREQAELALKLEDKYGKANVVSGVMNEAKFEQFKGITPETVALFASVTGMDQDAAYQEYLKLAIPGRSALKRKIHRKGGQGEGIEGFSTDLPRVLSSFVLSNARKSARDLYRGPVEDAVDAIPKDAGGVQEQAQKMSRFVLEPDENDWSVGIRNMLFVWNMGASVAFGVLNLSQPWMMTLPWLSQFRSPAEVAGIMGRAAKLATAAQVSGKAPKGYEAEYDRAVREGIVDPQNVFMLQGVERGKSGVGTNIWRNVAHGMGLISSATESMNRKLTLIAALDVARAKGDAWLKSKGFADAYDFAARAVAETQGIYNKGNRPAWARSPVGAVLLVFKQYAINWVEMAGRMASNHYGDDRYRKGFWMLIGALFMMAGGMGLPFAEDLIDLIETGMSWAGKPVNVERQMQMALGKDLYEPLMNGPVNSLLFNAAGADMFGRMSMGNLIPATAIANPGLTKAARADEGLEALGAGAGLFTKFMDSYNLAAAGKAGQAAINASPRAITSVAKAVEMATTGEYKDGKGRNVRDVTPAEALIKGLDLQPASVARIQRERGRRFKDEAIQAQAKDVIRGALIDAYESEDRAAIDEAERKLEEWNRENPLYPVRINRRNLRKTVRERGKNWSARDEATKGMEWMDEWIPEKSN